MANGQRDTRHPTVRALERMVESLTRDLGPDHGAARNMTGIINKLRLSAEALDRANANPSPMDTPARHAVKMATMARRLGAEVTTAVNQGAEHYRTSKRSLQERIEAKTNLKADAFAPEIRAAFRGMSVKAQMGLISKLTKEGRGPELAAIVKAPALLSGLSEEQRAAFETGFIATHAGAELDEQEKVDGLVNDFCACTRAIGNFASEIDDPAKVARIERDAATAEEASASFTQSLQP